MKSAITGCHTQFLLIEREMVKRPKENPISNDTFKTKTQKIIHYIYAVYVDWPVVGGPAAGVVLYENLCSTCDGLTVVRLSWRNNRSAHLMVRKRKEMKNAEEDARRGSRWSVRRWTATTQPLVFVRRLSSVLFLIFNNK